MKKSVHFSAACLAAGFAEASAKAHDQSRNSFGALKRSFPRINAGAPTKKYTPWVSHSIFPQPVQPCRYVCVESWASAPEGIRTSSQHRSPSVAKATIMTAAYGTAEAVPLQSVKSS